MRQQKQHRKISLNNIQQYEKVEDIMEKTDAAKKIK
jgi:hypothetical protein